MTRTNLRRIAPWCLAAALLVPAPALASDATSRIVHDVAADGHVDGHYSHAQLSAALHSALLDQYGGSGSRSAVEAAVATTPKTPAKKTAKPAAVKAKPAVKKVAAAQPGTGTTSSGNLPFTGADVALFAGIGGVMLAAGVALRRLGRNHGDGAAS
jgi:hypothetical protein